MKTYPLLQSQLGVMLQSMQNPGSTQYNLPICIFMPLPMTLNRVALVTQRLVDSIPELHTRFVVDEQDEIRQWSDMSMQIPVVSRQSTEAELQAYIHDGFIRPFNPFGGEPLFRTEVVATEKGVWLLADGHHTIVDGMSLTPVLTRSFAKIAEGKGWEGLPPFGMYQAAEAEVASFGSEAYQRAKDYFARKFTGHQMATLSWGRYGEPGPMGRATAIVGRSRCEEWCREYSVNPSHLFQAAFGYVMSVLTREEQVAFTAENHGRGDRRLLGCVGMFVKTIPMLIDANPACRVIDFVRSQREELKEAISHIDYPFTHFCRDLGLKPGVAFNFMAVKGLEERVQMGGTWFRVVQPVRNEIDSDLSVSIYTKGDDYEIRVESSLAMNDEATLRMVAEAMKVTVGSMMAHPEQTLGELDIVSTDEREALIALGRGKQIAVDPQMTFVKAFEQCASRVPDNIAVADADSTMTYGELSRRSDILAQRLIASGVCPDDFVAVRLDRTIEFPLAVIAIHKAGAAYVPIDLEYPEERQQYMLADCQAKLVIDEQFMAGIDFTAEASPVDLSSPAGLAYMIYTSGSTGRPKGVMIHQAGLWNFINMVIDMEHLTADDRISLHRSFSFDAHIQDMYPILTLGGSLHIMAENIRMDLAAIRNFLFEHQITGGGYATPMATLLLNTYDDLPVRFMTVGGEKLAGVYSDHIEIINAYGPTECTDDTSYYVIPPGYRARNIPIGKSVANCYNFITDRCGRLLPRGAVGELCFAGIQVGRGYWRRPELTAEKFVACPFLSANEDGQPVPMYRTGDLCRWNADGELEYIGRIDNQVKLRGYRIELGEIEACASRQEGISQAVAVVRPIGGSDALCLYYTADSDIDESALRHSLSQTLADYMVPTVYMQMDALPLTSNGKVDRRRLPEPIGLQTIAVAPATELESQLFGIVSEQLGTDDFGVTTDLVTLGMSSIDAMRLSLAINRQTGLRLTVGELLEHATVRQMAETAYRQKADTDIDLADFHHEQDSYPLTANQRGVYIDWELNRDTTQYNTPVAICFGQTDPNRLAAALRQVVDGHSYIKTRLARHDDTLVQLCRDEAPVQVSVAAIDREPAPDFFQQRVRPFNLFTDNLYRLEVFTYGEQTWLFKDFHHIVSDGLSDAIFFRDLQAALQGTKPRKETVTAFDYALYEQALSDTTRYAEARDYFDALLAETEAASYPPSAHGTEHRVGSVTATVTGSEAIRKACRRMGITPNSYFQTVVTQVLHRLTRQEHLMIATVSSGRPLAKMGDIMGMFVKTLPLVSTVDSDSAGTTFSTAAQTIHRQSIESMRRDFYPLTEVVERHGLRPEIIYAFEGGIYDNIAGAFSPDTDLIVLSLDTPKMPVEVTVYPDRQGVYTILLNYDQALYSHASIAALASALTAYAAGAAKEGVVLGDIELTTGDEREALIALGRGKQIAVDPQMTFVKAFEQCASRVPDNIAVADADSTMTYGELSRRSDILAQRLIASGVCPDDFVAVRLDRTIEFPLAVIAIHKAGAAYVPIDPEYPEERQQYMLDDSQAKLVIDEQFMAGIDFTAEASPVDLSSPAGLAYMIYTSGSTGRPKGAMIHQAGLWNFISMVIDMEHLTADDRISLHRSFSFDAHIEDLYPILTLGGSLHIMPESIRMDLAAIRNFLFEHQITGCGYATPIATLLLNAYDDLPMRFMTAGGEKLAGVYSDHIEIINVYGPTECTDDTSYYRIPAGSRIDNIPIGKSVANCYNFITDRRGRLLPRGAVGELCFAGIQVGRGYWQRPELTAEKFVACPFLPANEDGQPVRMYHTGDLCRWNSDGELEYIGRIDNQVKLRGYRIELGEIEACASRQEGISQAVAVVRPIGGSDALCLYFTADSDIDESALRDSLSQKLASYMVPTVYMQMDALPLTPSGKVDRLRLPEPSGQQAATIAPATELESRLFAIVSELLGTEDFGVTTNLVTLGMSSIDAMRLSLAIDRQTGLRLTAGELLEHATIRQMAETASRQQADTDVDLADYHHQQDSYPLTANQRGIYIDWELNRDTTQYNTPVAICFGQTDPNRLAAALRQVVDAHSYIKTRLAYHDGNVVQLCRDEAPVRVSVTAIDNEPGRDFFQQRVRPFNLFADNLYRIEVYAYRGQTWLFKDFHHIVSDGLSDALFFRDLQAALHGTKPNKETVTAFDYALYEQGLSDTARYAEARDYFDALLAEAETASYPRTAHGEDHRVGSVVATVAGSEAIRKACRRMGITPNSYFQTVVTQVLHRLTRQEKLMIATVSNGRPLAQMGDIMGMFARTQPLVSMMGSDSAATTFSAAAQAIHRQSIENMRRDFYPLTEVVERHGLRPEILYAFEGGIYDNIAAAFSPDTDVVVPSLDTPKMPVEVMAYPDRQGIYTILLNYDTALYSHASITALAHALTAYADNAVKEGVLLGNIELTTGGEREALVALGAGKHLDLDPDKTYMDYFLQRAAACPDALAVADDTGSLSYSQLDKRSDLIADRLLAAGVRPRDFVGVMTERTRDFPVCVLGIHKAGAAYLPLDPAYPTDRLNYMLKDSTARILITTHALLNASGPEDGMDVGNLRVVCLDDIDWEGEAAKTNSVNRCTPDGYTYIIYTSGSTGQPKGAVLHQRGLLSYIFSTIEELELTSDDRISSHRSFSFDSHIEDMYPILLLGGSLHIMPERIRKDPHGIYEFVVSHRVTGGGYPTAIAKLLVDTFDLPVRYVSAIGERLTGVVSRTCKIFNFYGPTECTDHISVHLLQRGREYDNIPIGHVVANNWCFIVDTHGRLLPRGVVGELCIAGIQVGIGYWQRPDLTAEKFVSCPFLSPIPPSSPVRMYHTGDLCRWNEDGELEYIGRIDNQVKLRGYRVELGEIENCASRLDGVSQAVAAIRPINGTDTLCLYYTVSADSAVGKEALREFLSQKLADYMVPAAYMQMDALPTTPNGKVDRRRLPEPEYSLLHTDYVAPRNELERLIVGSFEKVLEQDNISIHDDFVHLGGDSLKAIKVILSLGKSGITVADVLNLRTPAAIAGHMEELPANLDKYTIESGCPLNNTQLFIFNDILKFGKYDSYLMPSLIPIDATYTDEQIRRALDMVFTAHPVLTMHVAMRDGVPYMEKGDKPAVMKGSLNPLKVLSLLMSGFDLYTSLSRHIILRILGKCYLLSVFHHLIFDVVSEAVFCRHFQRALEGGSLDFVDDHFLQVSAFHQEVKSTERYAEMDKYIRAMLGNLTEGHFYRNPGKRGRPGYHKRELGVSREQVQRAADSFGITKNILFTAAMAMTLSKLAGSDDVAFGFLDNGRDRFRNFEDLGLYITGMPLVVHVERHDMRAFLDHLTSVYNKLRQNNYFPFASLVQEFNIAPIILFQFFPDWILEDGKYNHLPKNEMIINRAVSTQKDFMVEALVDVSEIGDSYFVRIMYSGYYSRKMMKALAATYKETLSEMLKV